MNNTHFFLFFFLLSFLTNAQEPETNLDYYLPENTTYNPNIPTPKSSIGHEVGQWHVSHDRLIHYMRELAKTSNRIHIEERGTTFEGRPLLLLIITSPKNHRQLETIQKNHLALTDVTITTPLEEQPVVVYQGFSIHGNEPSGSNAALALAYHLAAAEGQEIETLLRHTVILFDPALNPDGLQRFASWVNMHKSHTTNPDSNDREFHEAWPGARTNHYWFDLNRDWLPAQLPESRARIATFHQWYPNILTDHHEMGTNSTFFFQPGVPSRTHPLTPKKNQKLTGNIAKYHAKALDAIGSLYYSEEDFDDFYYGKGSTFPDIQGGVGILFEQASSRGHAQESDNGVLTFPFTIRNQFTTGLSTLQAAVDLRQELLEYQYNFFKDSHNKKDTKGFVFGTEKDAARAYHLAEILEQHQVTIHEIEADFTHQGKHYKKGYSYYVPKAQKQKKLLEAVFEKRTSFTDSLFYDISAWTFPLAFHLNYSEDVTAEHQGKAIHKLQMPQPETVARSNYAYVMEWHEYYSPKALFQILDKGLRAKFSLRQFKTQDNSFDYGTILIPVQNQNMDPSKLNAFLDAVAKDAHVTITPVNTGATDGIDLGSPNFKPLKKPTVALVVGNGITPYDAGEIWHLLDQRFAMPVTKLDSKTFQKKDLSRYTHIILPNSWGTALDKEDANTVKQWVQAGGTLIGYKNAARWMKKHEFMDLKFIREKDTATNVRFSERQKFRGAKGIGGAIFETKVDRSHPIAFGYTQETLPMFKNSTLFLEKETQSFHNPIVYTDKPLLSGYSSKSNVETLANTSYFKAKTMGRGKVLLFTENTNFRAFWFGTNKLLLNALFFSAEM